MLASAKNRVALLVAGIVSLAGCNGSSNEPLVSAREGVLGDDNAVWSDALVGFIINGELQDDLISDPSFDKGRLKFYTNADGTKFVFYGGGALDGAQVAAFTTRQTEFADTSPIFSTFFMADKNFEMPANGTAIFVGDYAGLLNEVYEHPLADYTNHIITGDIRLVADFNGSPSISGVIENRVATRLDTGAPWEFPSADIVLLNVKISPDGSFSGVTEGGDLQPGGDMIVDGGTFSGLLGGYSGQTPVGGVQLYHYVPSCLDNFGAYCGYHELGAFISALE